MRLNTEAALERWAAKHGGIIAWQPASENGGRPGTEWTTGQPPLGVAAYVKGGDGQTASTRIAGSGISDKNATYLLALDEQNRAIGRLVQNQGAILSQMQSLVTQMSSLTSAVMTNAERHVSAQTAMMPGELAKGISDGIKAAADAVIAVVTTKRG